MDFKMDEQSYRDLNVFRSTENMFSLFDLFKKTKTVGGRDRLRELMRNPSNAIDDLQKRTAAIAFFSKSAIELNIDHDDFDFILHYLKYDRLYLRGNIIDSFLPWLRNRIKSNRDYYVVQVGIKHLFSLIKYADELASMLIDKNAPPLLIEWANKIKVLLEIPGFSYACALPSKKRFNFYQLGKLDSIFRKENRLQILDLLNLFYELDVLETLANMAKNNGFCLPSYIDNENISMQVLGLFHPALTAPIKNDLEIDGNNNLIFLSGSNMAGKSSLLKSIGTAVYLSHIGFPVPASSMRTTVFNGLITTINLADNIENGLSHYYSEVMRVKKVASLLVEREKMFVILDELYKGTNAKDAYEASLLTLNGLSAIPNSVYIISSHITGLAAELTAPNISFNYLEHLMIDEKPKFTYKLKEGVAKDGIGMYFIEKEGILGLLERAKR